MSPTDSTTESTTPSTPSPTPGLGFDLAGAKAASQREDQGIVVPLDDAGGTPMTFGDPPRPVTVTVAGTYSSTYRKAEDAQRERNLKLRRTTLTGEQLYRQQLDLVAACVLAWEGILASGRPLPCTRENAIAVLDAAPWIRRKVEEAMNDHEGFFASK